MSEVGSSPLPYTLDKQRCRSLAAGGGAFAYIKKGSKMSLRASAGVGGALLAAAWLMGSSPVAGVSLALGVRGYPSQNVGFMFSGQGFSSPYIRLVLVILSCKGWREEAVFI